ncbi:hypothetical protein GCM10022600_13150 [Qipengyuania pelagi]
MGIAALFDQGGKALVERAVERHLDRRHVDRVTRNRLELPLRSFDIADRKRRIGPVRRGLARGKGGDEGNGGEKGWTHGDDLIARRIRIASCGSPAGDRQPGIAGRG